MIWKKSCQRCQIVAQVNITHYSMFLLCCFAWVSFIMALSQGAACKVFLLRPVGVWSPNHVKSSQSSGCNTNTWCSLVTGSAPILAASNNHPEETFHDSFLVKKEYLRSPPGTLSETMPTNHVRNQRIMSIAIYLYTWKSISNKMIKKKKKQLIHNIFVLKSLAMLIPIHCVFSFQQSFSSWCGTLPSNQHIPSQSPAIFGVDGRLPSHLSLGRNSLPAKSTTCRQIKKSKKKTHVPSKGDIFEKVSRRLSTRFFLQICLQVKCWMWIFLSEASDFRHIFF